MVFSSYIFIFSFLPIVLIGYYSLSKLKNSIYQRIFLILSSLFFYGYYNVEYLLLIISSIVVNYIVAIFIQKRKSRKWLIIGIVFNVALIGYFKYCNFFVENVNIIFKAHFSMRNILLPLGISFFTFQQLSFLISVYKQDEKVEKFRDYCLFVSFFPQLVAGPIVLYSEMIPQFKDESRRYFNSESFASGLYIFSIGLFKKAVIADTIAVFADSGFSMTNMGLAVGWITAISYTLQIYFDFSGYSDMAIGLGKMFNIEIPFNFSSPYKSESITEFWRRWHITLGRALSTYIYIPLGGNRKGLARTCINLFLTFLVSGLWHGAAWTFVLWGMMHGLFVIVERIFKNQLTKVPHAIRVMVTFLITNCLWVLFRADSFSTALNVYKGMVNFRHIDIGNISAMSGSVINFPTMIDNVYIIGIICILLLIVFKCNNSISKFRSFTSSYGTVIMTVLLLSFSLLCFSRESVFIYFNF